MEKVMFRNQAFDVVESELDYQERQAKVAGSHVRDDITPGEHILAMEKCLADARNAWYSGLYPHSNAAEHIRKITALGFRFIEHFGAPKRGA